MSYDIIYPTAITVTSIEARPGAGHIVLAWQTVRVRQPGFNLYRSDHARGSYTPLNESLIPSPAPGLPTGAIYDWNDVAVESGATYYYQLESVDIRGKRALFGPVSATLPRQILFVYLPIVTK